MASKVKLTCNLCGLEDGACICAHIPPRPVECPWNPFPHDSVWGAQLDEQYRRDAGRALLSSGKDADDK